MEWAVAGTYLEACNCEAICPCRRIGGRPGTRSTLGICEGALSWAVTEGRAGDDAQREALARIFTGELGGSARDHFPWAWKESVALGWRPASIAIEHAPRRGWFSVDREVTLRVGEPVADQEPVTCVIPGHDRSGTELVADVLRVDEGPLAFEWHGKCAYQSTFEYSSAG